MPLASFAENVANSQGRLYKEADSPTRTPFARDRDRIIHCTAFRRLKGKTQVFVANEGDYYRTRLTHTIEVAQIARSIANSLNIDQDLAETVALAHDLGHPPFGHAGEDELHALTQKCGGFDHNVQTFRVVTKLENRYPAFEGLNLTWETLEGLIKHNGPVSSQLTKDSWQAVADFNVNWDMRPDTYASLEAQAAAIADDIAYNNHDVDDGLQAGLFSIKDLSDVPLIGVALFDTRRDWPDIDDRMLRLESVRRLLGAMVKDVIVETTQRLKDQNIKTAEDVRSASTKLVAFSPQMFQDLSRLRAFLYERMYKHYRMNRKRTSAKRVIQDLFNLYIAEPNILEPQWYSLVCSKENEAARCRVICDYIAGMTDQFAIEEHKKLFL